MTMPGLTMLLLLRNLESPLPAPLATKLSEAPLPCPALVSLWRVLKSGVHGARVKCTCKATGRQIESKRVRE